MKFLIKNYKELDFTQLVSVNGGCSGYCTIVSSKSYSYLQHTCSGSHYKITHVERSPFYTRVPLN